jgi:separase
LIAVGGGGAAAGCPAVVANLWDVTDKDIDRFSSALINHWLAPEPGSAAEDGAQDGKSAADAPVRATAAGKGHGAAAAGKENSMCEGVARSRAVCKLPHLIGAAPVCYGVPLSLSWGVNGTQQVATDDE